MYNDNYPEHAIVRRIDDLGRIVVSKEIRRALRISEGDPLAMWVQNGRIMMQRYSALDRFQSDAAEIAEVVSRRAGAICLITDRNRIIAIAGSKTLARSYMDEDIGSDIRMVYANKVPLRIRETKAAHEFALAEGKLPALIDAVYVHPVIKDHETEGAVILLKPGLATVPPTGELNELARSAAELGAELLLLKLEDR